jgi:hypothetical protein
MHEPEREALRAAIELLHSCTATFEGSESVSPWPESFTIRRDVATYTLIGHPTATIAYAWTEEINQAVHHRVVLRGGFARSPELAVRGFFLVQESGTITSTEQSSSSRVVRQTGNQDHVV